MRNLLPFLLLTMFCVAAVFAVSPGGRKGQQSSSPDNQAATQDLSQDGRKAIDDFNQRFIQSCRKMDNRGTLALWTDDGVDLLPGMDAMVGKTAIANWLKSMTDRSVNAKVLQCDVEWQKIQVSGDLAYEWGINTQTVSIPNRTEPFKNKGKITLILHRQSDGSWKLALESWNNSPQPKHGS